MPDYKTRAEELLLTPLVRQAFVVLNLHADATGTCPSCGDDVSRHEHVRLTHARTCKDLAADVSAS